MSTAVAALVGAFVAQDWTNVYVVSTTRPGLAWPVRVAGLWGGAEGSLLLFTALVSIAAVIIGALGGRTRPATALASSYGVVMLVSANPFERFDAPAVGGLGLQPVLEHPAMVWHPPILYLGLVGVIVPSLLSLSAAPPLLVRATSAVSLAFLTAGLATGAAWAHAELGWGGFWAWDPIESAGLVAWLVVAATLHVRFDSGRLEHRLLFALPGFAAVWATTLTRAGLTGSVHSFADRPGLRAGLLVTAFGWSATLAWLTLSARIAHGQGTPLDPLGRRRAMYLLVLAGFFVALGTYEPAVEQLFGGAAVGVSGVFFTRMLWPVVIVGAVLSVRADRRYRFALLGATAGVAATPVSAGPFGLAVAAAGGAVAASALVAGRSGRRGWLAHVGIGLLLVGVGGTVAATSSQVVLVKDRSTQVNGATVIHRGMELISEPTRDAAVASIEVDGILLRPELVIRRLRTVPTAEAATKRGVFDEIQVILADGTDGQASYRISRTPRLNLIWLGAALAVLGLLRRSTTRRRVGPAAPMS
jgi:cytochrome c-type biogenesis protein CcmF